MISIYDQTLRINEELYEQIAYITIMMIIKDHDFTEIVYYKVQGLLNALNNIRSFNDDYNHDGHHYWKQDY